MADLGKYVESWSPAPVTHTDPMSPDPVTEMTAILNQPTPGDANRNAVPPLWHWFYFLNHPLQSELGTDGHPLQGHFLPPIPDRQRMFAGGRCEIAEPLRTGEPAERTASLVSAKAKQGRTGEMLFVTQRNEFRQHGRTCLVEELDIVYRNGRNNAEHPDSLDTVISPQPEGPWHLAAQADPTLLFRFSALTGNSHRIHYDQRYVRDEEGYPDLVVHGPLLAILMLELVRRNGSRSVRSLSFRFRSPVFTGERLVACGEQRGKVAQLHVATARDARHATAEVNFA